VAEEAEIVSAPVLRTIKAGLTVRIPHGELAPPSVGEFGAVSIGPGHIPTVGPVIFVCLHHPDGTTLALTMGPVGYNAFAQLLNAAGEDVQSGQFDQPEVRQ
jgi:hypothetical protein